MQKKYDKDYKYKDTMDDTNIWQGFEMKYRSDLVKKRQLVYSRRR